MVANDLAHAPGLLRCLRPAYPDVQSFFNYGTELHRSIFGFIYKLVKQYWLKNKSVIVDIHRGKYYNAFKHSKLI